MFCVYAELQISKATKRMDESELFLLDAYMLWMKRTAVIPICMSNCQVLDHLHRLLKLLVKFAVVQKQCLIEGDGIIAQGQ